MAPFKDAMISDGAVDGRHLPIVALLKGVINLGGVVQGRHDFEWRRSMASWHESALMRLRSEFLSKQVYLEFYSV